MLKKDINVGRILLWLEDGYRVGISVALEQDWTGELGSWMGSSESDSYAIAAKTLSLTQSIPLDEAVDQIFYGALLP